MLNIRENKVLIRILCGIILITGLLISTVDASAITKTKTSSGHSFNKKWRAVYYDGSKSAFRVKMNYGYNTTLINEDYTGTEGSTIGYYHHQAIVHNNNGTHKGKYVKWSTDSRIEVRHKGKTITYKVYYKK